MFMADTVSESLKIALQSSEGPQIAHALSELHIEAIRHDESLGGTLIAERLQQLRDALWKAPEISAQLQPDHFGKLFPAVVKNLSEAQKDQLLTAYAQMGHLNEIANLAARENHFIQCKKDGKFVPGGVEEFVSTGGIGKEVYEKASAEVKTQAKNETASSLVEKLNQPVFEPVITSHPTNVNSKESMAAQRGIAVALNAIMHNEEGAGLDKVSAAVKAYAAAPVLNQENGADKNFTVHDETQIVLNSLKNIYDDLPRIYKEYDDALAKKGGYDPKALSLQLRLKSWGSAGDKDGNKNVTAEKTLEAIGMHTHAILGRYLDDLAKIEDPRARAVEAGLKPVYDTLQKNLLPALAALRDDGDQTRAGKKTVSPKELSDRFDTLSGELAKLRDGLDIGLFRKSVQDIYEQGHGDDKGKALDLLRKARIFGFEFAKIEYRETAEEYSRVVGAMVRSYQNMDDPGDKLQKLTAILTNKDKTNAAQRYERVKDKVIAGGADKAYGDDPLPITYHTMKRMELARDHAGMFQDNVLAECGSTPPGSPPEYIKTQGAVNFLEAQFVQQAAALGDKRPRLGIIPLFEEPDTMKNIDHIMRGAYENEAYKAHLDMLAKERHAGKSTQQIQIAQSDNARRAGIPAARAFIHEAHKKMHVLNAEKGIEGQFYVGGSISDAYRNGVRALSASVNAFGMHKFAKFTFQGGDTLNYFNTPFSNTRLFTRQFVHAAEKLKLNGHGWAVEQDPAKVNNVFDGVAIKALKKALDDYRIQDFTAEGIGSLLESLDYNREVAAGNLGSRSGNRVNTAKVDITKVRTIGFSEAMQHNDLLPSWIGGQTLIQHLKTSINGELNEIVRKEKAHQHEWSTSEEGKEFILLKPKAKTPVKDGVAQRLYDGMTAEQLHLLYERSPTFRDAMDKCAYGIAMSDMDRLSRRVETAIKQAPEEKKIFKNNLADYLSHLQSSYEKTGEIAYAALTGKDYDPEKFRPREVHPAITRYNSGFAKIAAAVTSALPMLASDIHRKSQYRAFAMYLKEQHGSTLSSHQDKLVHSALDTVVHGRMTKGDDLEYKKALEKAMKAHANGHAQKPIGAHTETLELASGNRTLNSWEL